VETPEQQIRREIARFGAISFARHMELALYSPGTGYYERPEVAPGAGGDFYTSVSVGPLFGELLAWRFARWLETLGDGPIHIVEAGAHHGQLAGDILRALDQFAPELRPRLRYLILEPSPARREIQRLALEPWLGRVEWRSGWADAPSGLRGVVFSNELLDAMPCHVFRWSPELEAWGEWGVGVVDGDLHWVDLPNELASPGAARLAPKVDPALARVLPDGFQIECSPSAVEWWGGAARALDEGWLATLDYGATDEDLLTPRFAGGTLRAYHRHQTQPNPLDCPGAHDLTAHVRFSPILQAGERAGLQTRPILSQGAFLTSILAEAIQAKTGHFNPLPPTRARQFQTLTHPAFLGRPFKALVQRRHKSA